MKLALLAVLALLAISLVGCGSQAASVARTGEQQTTPSATPSPAATPVGAPSSMSADMAARMTPSPTPTPTPVPPNVSGLPPKLAQFLRDKPNYEVLTGTAGWDIEWYPWTQVLTVRIFTPNRAAVERDVREYFAGFGVDDLSSLKLNWCESHPANLDLGKPRWECSLTPGK